MEIRLPNLGEGADSGVVVNILVKAGDSIQKDQPILELETDKAVGTIPASAAGVVQQIRVNIGDKISAGTVLLTLAESAGTAAAPVPAPANQRPVSTPAKPTASQPIAGIPPAAAPTVRRMAEQLGIPLAQVSGSGHGGRITVEDLRAYIQNLQTAGAAKPAPAPAPARTDFAKFGPILKKPVSQLRQTIARRMSASWAAVPRVTQFDEADITGLNELRKKFAPTYEKQGAKLTLTVFAIQAVVQTLKKHPLFNASLDEVANEIVLKKYFHIGIAVDTEYGLLVPVLRDADQKSMLQLAQELDDLAQEVFLKAYRNLGQFRGDAPFEHWLSRVAVRCCYDLLRKTRREGVRIPLDDLELPAADNSSADEAREVVQYGLSRLGPAERLVITLLELEERSVREIAGLTGWSESNVKVRAHRARQTLKSVLEEDHAWR